jgi:hypothetical protein
VTGNGRGADQDPSGPTEAVRIGHEFVAHAQRIWVAEKEIADRYAARARTLVTLASSVLGGTLLALGAVLIKLTDKAWAFPFGWRICAAALVVLAVVVASYFMLKVPILVLRSVRYPDEAKIQYWRDMGREREARRKTGEANRPTASYHLDLPEQFLDWVTVESDPALVVIGTQHLKAAEDLRARNRREKHRLQAGEVALTNGLRASWIIVAIFIGLIAVSFVHGGGPP